MSTKYKIIFYTIIIFTFNHYLSGCFLITLTMAKTKTSINIILFFEVLKKF